MKGQLKRGPPTDEILLLLWLIAVDRGFVRGHLLNQARDPVQGLLVGDVDSNALVVRNLAIDLVAFDAHGLTAWSRAGARENSQSPMECPRRRRRGERPPEIKCPVPAMNGTCRSCRNPASSLGQGSTGVIGDGSETDD